MDTNASGRLIDLQGGVNSLTLSAAATYNLNLANVATLTGSGGNDTINISSIQTALSINGSGGNDTLNLSGGSDTVTVSNVETVNGNTGIDTVTIGAAGPAVTFRNVENIIGSAGIDQITLAADTGVTFVGATIDLGGGTNDVVTLGVVGTPSFNLTLSNVEFVNSTGGTETLTLANTANGLSVDLGSGFDTINAPTGNNVLTVSNIENINSGAGNDTVTAILDPLVTNQSINLGAGTNILNLAGNNSTFVISVAGGNLTVNGVTTGGNENITLLNQQFNPTYNLGSGNDTLTLAGTGNTVTIIGVETVIGGGGVDTVNLGNGGNTLTVQSIEIVNGGTGLDTLTLGNSTPVAVKNIESVIGSAGADFVTLQADPGASLINASFDLGGSNDTVQLGIFGTPTINLTLANVETVTSSGGIETVNLQNAANGLSVDLGGGFDALNLASGNNTITVSNVETLNAFGSGNDNVTMSVNSSGAQINLGLGTDTLTLAGGNGNITMSVSGGSLTVIGSTTAINEHVTLQNVQAGTTFDLAAGTDDSLTLFGQSGFFSDTITVANTVGTTTVTAGGGADSIIASAGVDHLRYTFVFDSGVGGGRDTVTNFDAANDLFVFDGMSGGPTGFRGTFNFVDTGPFTGGGDNSEARLADVGGLTVLQIDIDGDGTMGANDMEIGLANLTGTLHNNNFLLI
jgi:hypothetical protein